MARRRGSVIAKIVLWLVELWCGFGLLSIIFEAWRMLTEEGEIFLSIIYGLVGVYLAGVIALVVNWLFNSLHRYNDFGGFRDMIGSLSAAPLLLVKHIVVHPFAIIRHFAGGSEPEKKRQSVSRNSGASASSSASSRSSAPAGNISNLEFNAKVESAVKNVVRYANPSVSLYSGVSVDWFHRPTVRVLGRSISIYGTVSFESTVVDGVVERGDVESCLSSLNQEIRSEVWSALRELCQEYGRQTNEWEVSVDIQQQ